MTDQIPATLNPSEDDACEVGWKAFKEALQCVKNLMHTVPSDKENTVDEKQYWTVEWDGSLVHSQVINLSFHLLTLLQMAMG